MIPRSEIGSGEQIRLYKHLDGQLLGSRVESDSPADCEGFWYVDGHLYGHDEVGKIDVCGVYQAPEVIHKRQKIRISVSPYLLGIDPNETKMCGDHCVACLDCCPYAENSLVLVPD